MICGEASYLWMNQDKWDVINYVRTEMGVCSGEGI